MAEKPSGPARSLDVQRIHYLVRLMKRYDLTALDVHDGSLEVRLRRRSPMSGSPTAPPAVEHPASTLAAVAPPGAAAGSPPPSGSSAAKTVMIESPMVGTYFASGAPEDPPFVSVGAAVHPNSIVCIIEAMKVFTDIPAGVSGTIAAILVKNGQAVEFGQPLFQVIPN